MLIFIYSSFYSFNLVTHESVYFEIFRKPSPLTPPNSDDMNLPKQNHDYTFHIKNQTDLFYLMKKFIMNWNSNIVKVLMQELE